MSNRTLERFARTLRPFMRNRTPLLYRLSRMILGVVCPSDASYRLVGEYEGGLINIDTLSSIERSILFRGCHEPEITKLIRRVVRRGDTCLDVGAHVGTHTLMMAAATGSAGRVIAVEPHPEVCARLRENLALNRLDQVTVVRAAITQGDGRVPLYGFAAGARNQGVSSLFPDGAASERIEVPTISGKSLTERLLPDGCDFIKIDVEGADGLVLDQLFGLIERHRPFIVFEYQAAHWQRSGGGVEPVVARLRAAGYDLYYVRDDSTHPLDGPVPPDCDLVCAPSHRETPLD